MLAAEGQDTNVALTLKGILHPSFFLRCFPPRLRLSFVDSVIYCPFPCPVTAPPALSLDTPLKWHPTCPRLLAIRKFPLFLARFSGWSWINLALRFRRCPCLLPLAGFGSLRGSHCLAVSHGVCSTQRIESRQTIFVQNLGNIPKPTLGITVGPGSCDDEFRTNGILLTMLSPRSSFQLQ